MLFCLPTRLSVLTKRRRTNTKHICPTHTQRRQQQQQRKKKKEKKEKKLSGRWNEYQKAYLRRNSSYFLSSDKVTKRKQIY